MPSKLLISIIAEQDDQLLELETVLKEDYEPIVFHSAEEARVSFEFFAVKIKAVLISAALQDEDPILLLEELQSKHVVPEYFVFSQVDDIEMAVKAVKKGAFDYLVGPFTKDMLDHALQNAFNNKFHLKKIKDVVSSGILAKFDIDVELAMASDIGQQRRQEGDVLTISDILEYFPPQDPDKKAVFQMMHEELKKDIDSKQNQKKTMLIVEDDPLFSQDLNDILEDKFTILLAGSGAEVDDICKQHHNIDVVLLDIYLPDTTGLKLLPILKERFPDTAIIMITGFKETTIAVNALREGAYDYVNKPFFRDAILFKIGTALQYYYFLSIIPKLKDDSSYRHITYKTKLDVLNEFCRLKLSNKESIIMDDIYVFFPEFKQCDIPGKVIIPQSVIDDGLLLFVDRLQEEFSC